MPPIRDTCLALACLSASCGAEEVGPTARIELTPELLCEGAPDTAVIASARGSMAVDGTSEGLTYIWSFSRPPAQIVRGGTKDKEIVAEFSTGGPVQVRLEVTDTTGERAAREQLLGLTRTSRVPCSTGCADHEICAPFGGALLCVDDLVCVDAEQCGCLTCEPDDFGVHRCIGG
jgi:hypothetical protein